MSWLRESGAEPIPGYRLLEPLGTGGFGEVWKCEAPGGIYKAIKFVYGNLNSLDGDALRAEQELKAIQRVKEVRHPFVVSMERIDNLSGELVIVMELADKSLHDVFTEAQAIGRLGIDRDVLLGYLRDAADGLDHLIEKHNLQHLDIKPRNLFLVADRVKVADFGLVKHLERSSNSGLMGGVSPLYAAPETFSGKISKQSDQYSLAVVYIELLTGKRPFTGRNIRQLAIQHMTEPPDLSMVPDSDRAVLQRALAKDPAKRYPNCLAFVRALYSGRADDAGGGAVSNPSLEEIDLRAVAAAGGVLHLREPQQPLSGESDLQDTIAQMEIGVLRPTILIGVGGFGRRALLELRCRLLDRFGDLSQVPMFRFLYVDSDPEAVRKAVTGSPDIVLSSAEVFPLPLQPVANYRRRQLEHLSDWLPREKLYGIPRSLQPQGSRALGRLAFSDNYLRFLTRLRREVTVATHPESVAQSVGQTGLALRDTTPRVYVMAAGVGGSGGLLADLGFAVKRLLTQLGHPKSPAYCTLYCGAPGDPATPKLEQANLYATLTELNHFADPAVSFSAQYGPDGPRVESKGLPFAAVYLTPIPHRSPEAFRDCVGHLASFLTHDLTTSLSAKLDAKRLGPPAADRTPFRGFGTYSVWFPRGLLLRVAARQVCSRLIAEWQTNGDPSLPGNAIDSVTNKALGDTGLHWELLSEQIDKASHTPADGTPTEALGRLMALLEEQYGEAVNAPDPGKWARQAMETVREWVGVYSASDAESLFRKSRLSRALALGTQALAERWEQRLSAQAFALMEAPGRRLAAAEAALVRMTRFCAEATAAQRGLVQQQTLRTEQARAELAAALEGCQGGSGFSLFGAGRTLRSLRYFMEQLTAFAQQRLHEDLCDAGVQFFRRLQGRLEERLRDLTFCRQRLAGLQQTLESPVGALDLPGGAFGIDWTQTPSPMPLTDPFGEALQNSATLHIVLPDGESDLERCAATFVSLLRVEHWTRLDQVLQALVLAPLGGLFHVCQKSSDLVRHLASPLIDQTAAFLGGLLPVTDVAQVEFSAVGDGGDVRDAVARYVELSHPLVSSGTAGQEAFVLVPASEAGQAFAAQAGEVVEGLHVLTTSGQTDLAFCREQGFLKVTDLQPLLEACRPAYKASANAPSSSPHARFDVAEWMPLE